jgi:hypothetical protein
MAKGKVLSLLEQIGANAKSLDSTALRSNALSPAEYLSLMRSRVLEEQLPGYLTRLQTLTELQQSLDVPAVPAPGSPGEATHSGKGKTSSKLNQNYSGASKIPPAGGSRTDPRYQSKMSGTYSNVDAPTTSFSSQKKREETKDGGGAGRGTGCDIASKWQENEQEKVNAGSRGRGRGYLLMMDSTDSPGESTYSGRVSTQNYSGSSKIPSGWPGTAVSGSATGAHCQSKLSGTYSHVAASTTSHSTQTKTEVIKAGGGAGRGKNGTSESQENSSFFNYGCQVGHPPGEPENYYKATGKAHPKPCQKKNEDGQKPDVSSTGQSTTLLNLDGESNQACEPEVIATYSLKGNEKEFSSEEETEQRAKQPKKSGGPVSYIIRFFSRSSK